MQNYTYSVVGPDSDLPQPSGGELTEMGHPFSPESLEAVIRVVAKRTKRPIYLTGNGVATEGGIRRVAVIDEAASGLAAVDRTTCDRTPKPGARRLGAIGCGGLGR